mmetsp:Transcript_33080/g.60680  ORF Transcript_33080/g.60680 Transcript_33080/m.60680 type:complete len:124 (-) Transcript_33080:256-627(-)
MNIHCIVSVLTIRMEGGFWNNFIIICRAAYDGKISFSYSPDWSCLSSLWRKNLPPDSTCVSLMADPQVTYVSERSANGNIEYMNMSYSYEQVKTPKPQHRNECCTDDDDVYTTESYRDASHPH